MTEDERQLMISMLSGALAAAQAAQMLRVRKADAALRRGPPGLDKQVRTERQLRAERETAAVLWQQFRHFQGPLDHPEQLAQAWASAVAWESYDQRAAATARLLDQRLRAHGVHPDPHREIHRRDNQDELELLFASAERSSQLRFLSNWSHE